MIGKIQRLIVEHTSVFHSPSHDSVAHLELLRLLEQHPDYSQRQLSVSLGISLGKTHYVLKALLEKGLVKAQNFRRSDRKLGYLYVLTPQGVQQRFKLTQSFLARRKRDFEMLQTEINALRKELADQSSDA